MIYHNLYITVLILLAIMLFPCLVRAVRGPRIADRLVSVNMMVMIAVLALLLDEGYLVDICLLYAMISFLAVVVLSKVYIGIYEEKRHKAENPDEEEEGGMSDGSF